MCQNDGILFFKSGTCLLNQNTNQLYCECKEKTTGKYCEREIISETTQPTEIEIVVTIAPTTSTSTSTEAHNKTDDKEPQGLNYVWYIIMGVATAFLVFIIVPVGITLYKKSSFYIIR